MTIGFWCGLALLGSGSLTLVEGNLPPSGLIEILPLENLSRRVTREDLAIESSGERTKVTSSDDSEVLIDASPEQVAERVCDAKTRHTLNVPGHGEVVLCQGSDH